ncbi:MAG: hypothetical protein JWM95_1567 [Gemmatimonadetes bacterium]|nr:hypothetical protein [Gemmatimonadota bacterium]
MPDTGAFRFEQDLVASFKLSLPSLLYLGAADVVTSLYEETIGDVVPDVLIGVWQDDSYVDYRPLTYVEAHLLSFITQSGPLSADDLGERLHLTSTGANRALKRLLHLNTVAYDEDGCLRTQVERAYPAVQIVAFEAKLVRWKDALEQAETYLRFANRAFVVLDGSQIALSARVVSAFKDSRVGLYLQHDTRTTCVLDAAWHLPLGPDRIVAIRKLGKAARASRYHSLLEAGNRSPLLVSA